METSQILLLGEGLELTGLEMGKSQLVLHITATSRSSPCPVCAQPATRLHSRYSRVVKDLPCVGQQVQLILHVRKFFCDTAHCVRKIFAERLPQLVAPWAQMTTRLRQGMQDIGLATCGRLGARCWSIWIRTRSLISCQTVRQKPPSPGCKPIRKLRTSAAIAAVSMLAPPLVALLKRFRWPIASMSPKFIGSCSRFAGPRSHRAQGQS